MAHGEVPGAAPHSHRWAAPPGRGRESEEGVAATKRSITAGTAEDGASGLREPAGQSVELGGVGPHRGGELGEEVRLTEARVGRQVEEGALTAEALQALILLVGGVHPILEADAAGDGGGGG